jgi:hypothetical protein
MDTDFQEYKSKYTKDTNPSSCKKLHVLGCIDRKYKEYNKTFTKDTKPTSCKTKKTVKGCTDSNFQEYDRHATQDDGSCKEKHVLGCMDNTYKEFKKKYTKDTKPTSCINKKTVKGCMQKAYKEFNPKAKSDTKPTSCKTPVQSCNVSGSSINELKEIKNKSIPKLKEELKKYGIDASKIAKLEGDINELKKDFMILKTEIISCKTNNQCTKCAKKINSPIMKHNY